MTYQSTKKDDMPLLETARRIIAARSLRTRFLDAAIFGEPAWDILLALYSGEAGGQSTAKLLAGLSGAPVSTILRWLKYLEEQGFVMLSCSDLADVERSEVHLTHQAYCGLEAYLLAMKDLDSAR